MLWFESYSDSIRMLCITLQILIQFNSNFFNSHSFRMHILSSYNKSLTWAAFWRFFFTRDKRRFSSDSLVKKYRVNVMLMLDNDIESKYDSNHNRKFDSNRFLFIYMQNIDLVFYVLCSVIFWYSAFFVLWELLPSCLSAEPIVKIIVLLTLNLSHFIHTV